MRQWGIVLHFSLTLLMSSNYCKRFLENYGIVVTLKGSQYFKPIKILPRRVAELDAEAWNATLGAWQSSSELCWSERCSNKRSSGPPSPWGYWGKPRQLWHCGDLMRRPWRGQERLVLEREIVEGNVLASIKLLTAFAKSFFFQYIFSYCELFLNEQK